MWLEKTKQLYPQSPHLLNIERLAQFAELALETKSPILVMKVTDDGYDEFREC